LGEFLRQRQQSAEQSEALLHTLIEATPMAILLLEDGGAIEYANDSARTLFFEGRSLAMANFLSMLGEAPAAFREAVLGDQDCLFSVTTDGAPGPTTWPSATSSCAAARTPRSTPEHAFHQDIFEAATAIKDCVDLNDVAEEAVEDPPGWLLNLAPCPVTDGAELWRNAATARQAG
jgi:hypothetical protein